MKIEVPELHVAIVLHVATDIIIIRPSPKLTSAYRNFSAGAFNAERLTKAGGDEKYFYRERTR